MRAVLNCGLLLLALAASCQAYSYQRGGYGNNYQTQASYSSSSSSSSSSYAVGQLNSWGQSHLHEVREFANRLKKQYNWLSQGNVGYSGNVATAWSASILELTRQTASQLDEQARQISQQLDSDMRQGLLNYATISQPNFFDVKSAEVLQRFAESNQHMLDLGSTFQAVDLSNFDEVKNYAYPAEVKVIDGRTFVVQKNCTEASKMTSDFNSALMGGYHMQTPSTSTTITRKKTTYDFINEPTVMDYRPVVSLNGMGASSGAYNQIVVAPATTSTVTIRRVNKTITTNADGTNSVAGSETQQRWVNGQLVYDNQSPFGSWSVPRDEAWKREERERFFWFLTQGSTSLQRLEAWQRQQEERLLGMSERYQTDIERIKEFHRQELQRYHQLLGQYQAQTQNGTAWQRQERGRLDWLIHQNSFTVEEFERWQQENSPKLVQLAQQYRISPEMLQKWQLEELQRLYVYFNNVNSSISAAPVSVPVGPAVGSVLSSGSLVSNKEQERLDELIRQHNMTISALQSSIRTDQQKLKDLSATYQGNVQDTSKWLKQELARISGLITAQHEQMARITDWQRSERARLESILSQHQGSVGELQQQMATDRSYIQGLAAKYHVSIAELEKWQRTELERLQREGQQALDANIKEWQLQEREHLKTIIGKNDLSIDEFQTRVINDRARLEQLARTYKVQVTEIEEWIKSEIKKFQSEGLLKEVEKELALWQQRERERLQSIVQQNSLTVEQLEQKIKHDQAHFYELANTYQIRVEDIQEWLKKELVRLQGEGLIKAEALKDWQLAERTEIMKIVQLNKYTIDDFEKKLLADRQRLQDLSKTYNVQVSEIERWILSEGERLQREGQLKMQEQLNNWQKIERQRLLDMINKNNLSIEELEARITKDQVHLYSLAQQHQVRVEEIEEWIKQQIQKLKADGLIEMEKLKNWQMEWRGNLTNMVQERDYTVEEFHKWLLQDRSRLQSLAMQHNVQIEEIEQFVKREEQRFISMGLLKPSEKLTNWQEVERMHLERLTQQQYKSTEQLEARLRQDRELLEKLAREYSVQVEEIEKWMKQELARLRDEGQLQIDNLTAWQLAERERLEALVKQNKQWSAADFEAALRSDREHMQTMAFQYHTSVEEIERWVQSEIERLKQQGKLDIEKLTVWQQAEQQRIMGLLKQQSSITVEEFEEKVQRDRLFLVNLADQYHVSVVEIEAYIKQVIEDLRKKGQFEIEKLQSWQLVERDYIKQLIQQYNNGLSTTEYEQKLLADRVHLNQLADHYRINVEQIEQWMIAELKRLRGDTETQLKKLTEWQQAEVGRLQKLLQQQNKLSYVEFEVELQQERKRLEQLAQQYSVSVTEIEEWLRQQLLNLKTTGQIKVENLTKWQAAEQQRLIELLLKQQQGLSYGEFEQQLKTDHAHLQSLSQTHHVSIEQIEQWMRDEVARLKNSGLVQVERQTIWQNEMSSGFNDWLDSQHNGATYKEFVEFLKRDKERISGIAREYHITVEEVEKWVQKEAARLSLIGVIQRPADNVSHEELIKIWQQDDNQLWKQQTAARLETMAMVNPMSWEQFEQYLVENRPVFEQFSRQYKVTVEDIELWLRQSANKLSDRGLIGNSQALEEWQRQEQSYIQQLINDQLRRHHRQKWTIEELELKLVHDQQHVRTLMDKYKLSMEELEAWYKRELQRLLDQRKLIPGNTVEWQLREMERIYVTAIQHPQMNRHQLEELLLSDANIPRLALEYHVSEEILKLYIRQVLRRLADLGLIMDVTSNSNRWEEEERQRLIAIASTITITKQELMEFISNDDAYQELLSNLYGVGLSKLAPHQSIIIRNMEQEQRFQNLQLNRLEPWQQRERDRLYDLVRNQNFSLRNLQEWQRQDIQIDDFARKYGISVHELKEWQLREFQRIMQVAQHYQMSLSELQRFRDRELRYLTYIMHKKTSTEHEIQNWERNEATRMQTLQHQSGKTGQALLEWRRTLYLLSQGLIDLHLDGTNGGKVLDAGRANASFVHKPVFSKDRGDQPPYIYEETLDEEPGLEGETKRPPYMPIVSTPVPLPYAAHSSPATTNMAYRYRKQEYQVNVPIGTAAAAASSGPSSSAAAASVGMTSSLAQQVEDLGQQQQTELGWNGSEDAGQQQQQELSGDWNAKYQGSVDNGQQQQQENYDLGQQQVQVEDLHGQQFGSGKLQQQVQHDNGQQQVQLEDLHGQPLASSNQQQSQQQQQSTPPTVEVQAQPEPTSIWGKFKKKTSDWIG